MKWVSLFMCMVGLLVGCEGNEDTVDDGNSLNWSLFRGDASLSGYTVFTEETFLIVEL